MILHQYYPSMTQLPDKEAINIRMRAGGPHARARAPSTRRRRWHRQAETFKSKRASTCFRFVLVAAGLVSPAYLLSPSGIDSNGFVVALARARRASSHLSHSRSGRPAARTRLDYSMNVMKEGWFTEIVNTNNNPVLSVDVEKVLHQERSNFQDILVFKSKSFGTVLALDNAIQCTERDEFSYQEMITFLPLNCHPDPKDVLIIGGGDGGVAREVVKHPSVVSVTQCEIDEKVVEVSKKYLPFMAEGFNSPKLELKIGDGFQFIKETTRKFDVVITDSSDPIGPAEALFQKPYYEGLKRILKPGGILCSQGESMWFDLKLIEEMMDMCRSLFPVVNYASIYTPTYPSGQIGFLLCSTSPDTDFRNPVHKFTEEQLRSMKIRYYSPEVHQAALALPRFVKQTLYK